MKRVFYWIFLALGLFAIASCNTVNEANRNINTNQDRIDQANDMITKSSPAAITNSGYYVNQTPINIVNAPKWLNQRINVSAQGMPFNLLISRILRNTNANISYQAGTPNNMPVTFSYSGTIKGALDALASQVDYAYNIDDSTIEWSALITQTFNISFMPGASNYFVGQNAGDRSSGGSAGGSGSGDIVTVSGNLGNSQFSNLQGRLSVWDDLRSSLNQLKSNNGKVWISEATTTVTVQDHPSNVKAIARYLKNLNKVMTDQVSIRVTVLELTLNKNFNYGIDWNLVQGVLGNQIALTGGLGSATNLSGALAQAAGDTGLLSFRIGRTDGSNAIIQALSQQGKLSVVTQPTVVTMNNQVAEIRITQDTGYLQSITTSTISNAGTQTSLTPGVVTDGFSLYLLPKIQGDEVYLQISSTLSSLVNLTEVNNKGVSQQSNPDDLTAQQDFQSIQVPTLAEKHFNQRTVLNSGATLVITGFQQLRDQTREVNPYGVEALGGKGVKRDNIQTIVLITPTIVRGTS